MLRQLRKANIQRNRYWDPEDKLSGLFFSTELGGEVGEALNVVKKLEREKLGIRGSRDTIEHLAQELADIIICTDLLANKYGIDLVQATAVKFNETSDKVGLPIYLKEEVE